MHNNNNTTHQCVDPIVSGSGGPYTSLELRDGQQTDKDTLSARKAARETSLNSAPLTGPQPIPWPECPVRHRSGAQV